MFAGARDQRQIRRDRRQAAADRHIGQRYWFWYSGGETLVKTAMLGAALGFGSWLLWTRVDHRAIAAWAVGIGLALVLAYAAWTIRNMSPYVRTMRLARGVDPWISPVVWHVSAMAGVLFLVAGIMLWRSVP